MNLIFICPNFPVSISRFCMALGRNGVTVLGIGDAPYDRLDGELRVRMREYYRVSSLEDRAQVMGAASYFKNKYGKIDRIESLQEHWLPMEALLRGHLQAPGRNVEQTTELRRKSCMKERFQSAGVHVARGTLAENEMQVKRFIASVGYPVVAKPDSGVGAHATHRLDSDADLPAFLNHLGDTHYFLEEYIDGELLSFDGLVNKEGKLCFSSSMVFPLPIMHVLHEDLNLYYYTLRETPADLQETGERSIAAFGLRDTFFHLEFFRRKDSGELVAVEANLRPPGLLTTDMWDFTYDMDIYEKWARYVAHNTWEAPGPRKYFVCYASRKHNRLYRRGHEEVLEFSWPHLVCFEQIPPIYRAVGGDMAYLLRAPTLEPLLPLVRDIQAEV